MQFHLFNIRPKLHHRKWRKLRVTLTVNRRHVHAMHIKRWAIKYFKKIVF